MVVEFQCQECNQRLSVDSDSVGKTARCPKCSTLQKIPNPEPSTPPHSELSPMEVFCPECGTTNSENNFKCIACGFILHGPSNVGATRPPVVIPNYLVQAILATLFCCLPFGIAAIVYAAQVNGKIAGGDIEGAQRDSDNAKMWAWISFGFGIAWIAIATLYNLLLIFAFAARANV